jgi:serine/threonine protein kinase
VSRARIDQLGRYRLVNVVNVSQHCQLWQAYDDARGCAVAIKTLLERFQRDKEHIGYLKREFEIVGNLIHERIIRIYEFGIDRGSPYLAMEWFPSPNLKVRSRQGEEALAPLIPKIVVQTAEALAVFNGRGWVHRDIKPENFLVTDEGDVKLIDFSLAKRRKNFFSKLFAGKSKVQGTRSYMSPEQIRGESLDERADLYSLGCTLFELLAGRPPYTGINTNDLLTKHLRAPIPSLEVVNKNVSPAFAQLIRQTMAKAASERPKSSKEFFQRVLETPVFRRPVQPASTRERAQT